MAGQRIVGRAAASVTSSTDEQPVAPPQDELRAVAERVRGAFPKPFSATELVLIDVDPTTLHAFWTIPLSVARRARRTLGATETMVPLMLRVRALGDDDHSVTATFDVDVVGLQSQTYVSITRPERFYSADIGVVGRGGVFQALVTSNTARLPRLPLTAPQPVARPADADVAPAARAEAAAPAAGPASPLAVSFPPPPDRPGAYDPAFERAADTERKTPPSDTDTAPPNTDAVAARLTRAPGAPPGAWDRGMPLPFVGPFPLPPSEAGIYDPLPGRIGDPTADALGGEGRVGEVQGRVDGSGEASLHRTPPHATPPPLIAPFPPPPSEPGIYDPLPGRIGDTTADALGGEGRVGEVQARVGGSGEASLHRTPPHATPPPVIAPFPPPPGEAGVYDPHPYGALESADHVVAGEGPVVAGDYGDAAAHGFEPGGGGFPDETASDAVFEWSGRDTAEWAPSSAVFSAFGAPDDRPAIGDIRIEIELFGRARPGHYLFLLGRRVALRPDGTFSCTHRLAGDDATIAMFLNHGEAAPATSVMTGDAPPSAAGIGGDVDGESEDERVLALDDDEGGAHDVQLEVNAVLRVSGCTERDGGIHILGRAVTPDAEGRFSLGYPLPHGALFISALLTAPENPPAHRNVEDAP